MGMNGFIKDDFCFIIFFLFLYHFFYTVLTLNLMQAFLPKKTVFRMNFIIYDLILTIILVSIDQMLKDKNMNNQFHCGS